MPDQQEDHFGEHQPQAEGTIMAAVCLGPAMSQALGPSARVTLLDAAGGLVQWSPGWRKPSAYDVLLDLLRDVYHPAGAAIWLTARHKQFQGLTVDEMHAAGRMEEVLAAAERLVTGAFA